jgi:hypothetical protein
MQKLCPACHSKNDHSGNVCSVCGTVLPRRNATCSPNLPWQRWTLPHSDILAAALGSILLFGGVINEVMYVAAVEIGRNLRPDVQGHFAGFLYLMIEVFPIVTLITLWGIPIACIRRTRSITGGVIASILSLSIILVGRLALAAPDPWRTCLLILPNPGWVARAYMDRQWWGALATMIQIVLGVVVLNSFRRPRPLNAAADKSSPPPAPSPSGDGENENA